MPHTHLSPGRGKFFFDFCGAWPISPVLETWNVLHWGGIPQNLCTFRNNMIDGKIIIYPSRESCLHLSEHLFLWLIRGGYKGLPKGCNTNLSYKYVFTTLIESLDYIDSKHPAHNWLIWTQTEWKIPQKLLRIWRYGSSKFIFESMGTKLHWAAIIGQDFQVQGD